MVSIPGVPYANPGTYAEGQVVSNGVSVPSNNRILCVLGEGTRREVIVNYAAGHGADGLDPTYTTSLSGTDGRHFRLSNYPVISRRTTLIKNGVDLVGKEEPISTTPIAAGYDYRIEISTGKIELKGAALVDQGGSYYVPYGTNVGNGTITNLSLLDLNAPTETWTIRCSNVRRDGYGIPIDGYARFSAIGSVSGVILDGYGAPVTWQSDGTIRNNGILRFAINEGSTAFDTGDTFTVKVESGVLVQGDNLLAEYIATLDINDPEFFTDMDAITTKHGLASLTNTVSLACQLAFTNGVPGVLCCEAAPGMPRRIFYRVVETATGYDTDDDLTFILPLDVIPNSDSDVKFLIVDTVTGIETQIIPNKVDFYNATITANPSQFINFGQPYSYTVIMKTNVKRASEDLVIVPVPGVGPNYYGTISSPTLTFDLSDYTATITIHIFDAVNAANNGTFAVTGVNNGTLTIVKTGSAFVAETGMTFREYDTAGEDSAYILFTKDLALTQVQGLKAGVIDYRDASFYDAGWTTALEKLESFELDILAPFPTTTKSAIIQSCLQHCLNMSRIKNRKERVLFTGAIQGLTPDNVTGVDLAAVEDIGVIEGIQGDDPAEILAGDTEDLTNYSVPDAFGSTYRCVYHYPDRVVVNISGSNTYVDGMFMAAAHGGLLSATGNVATPSTNKTIGGFSILRDRVYSTTVSENITKAGITLVEPVLGGGRIVWGKTTSQSGYPEEEEISIVFIRDKVAKMSRSACQGFIGQAETPTFSISLQTRINSLLLSLVGQELITKFANILVKRNATDPRQWDITFAVQPVYPVGWIYIKFDIGTI